MIGFCSTSSQLDHIFFFCGLGFLLLWEVCVSLSRSQRSDLPWRWFAAFALLHCIGQWLSIPTGYMQALPLYSILQHVVIATSYVCLAEFGRRGTPALVGKRWSRGLATLLVILGVSGLVWGDSGLEFTSTYVLGCTGAIWSMVAFLLLRQQKDGCTAKERLRDT